MPWPLIAECIVVDNGSTDETAAIATQAGARVIQSQRGYGAACLAGSNAALPTSTILVYMDGDGSDILADLPRLIDPILTDKADFVVGSRIRGKREPGSMLASQLFAGRFVGLLLRTLGKGNYTDNGPFRAIRRTSLEQLQMSELTYGWNLEMQIKAAQHNLRILEIPVDYRKRIGGPRRSPATSKPALKPASASFRFSSAWAHRDPKRATDNLFLCLDHPLGRFPIEPYSHSVRPNRSALSPSSTQIVLPRSRFCLQHCSSQQHNSSADPSLFAAPRNLARFSRPQNARRHHSCRR